MISIYIHSFILDISVASPLLLRGATDYSIDTVSESSATGNY